MQWLGGPLVDLELLVSLVMEGMRKLSGVSFTRALIPFPKLYCQDLIVSQRPHCISFPLGRGGGVWISTYAWGWGTNLQAIAVAITGWKPVHPLSEGNHPPAPCPRSSFSLLQPYLLSRSTFQSPSHPAFESMRYHEKRNRLGV